MANKLSTEDEAILINLVQERPCLYDKGNGNYKNTRVKEAIWTEIVTELADKGVHLTEKRCIEHWTKLRSQFMGFLRRVKKPSGGAGGTRPYFRHELSMMFLKDTDVDEDRTHSNITEIEVMSVESSVGDDNSFDVPQSQIEYTILPLSSPDSGTSEGHRSHSKGAGSKRKLDQFDKELIKLMKVGETQDEFQSFGNIISARLRTLANCSRISFLRTQLAITNIITEEELRILEEQSIQP